MSTLRLRWRFFWSRRSRRRTRLALLLLFASLLVITYVTLPQDGQHQVHNTLTATGRGIHSLGLHNALLTGVALGIVLSLLLIFLPSYKSHSYLATSRSIIPPVSVYLDAENQLSEAAIRPFTDFLIKHLDGRRADLLYFLDASVTASGNKYKTLYRHGFRPVDVPHNPTGKGRVKEAVDRELAMHAYERAVLGPPDQEFIIVTGDADFVPLIYRLVALGHRVQIWAAPVREAYKVVETYLGVNVIDLTQIVRELEVILPETTSAALKPAGERSNKRRTSHPGSRPQPRRVDALPSARIVAPSSLSRPGEDHFYFAITETLAAQAHAQHSSRNDNQRNGNFCSLLSGKYAPRLASVGYSAGNWIDYWVDHLKALGVLSKDDGRVFPSQGAGNHEDAARSLSAMAERAARAALLIAGSHGGGLVRMSEVATAIASESSSIADATDPLLALVGTSNGKRITHTRYFVRSARALGLLEFDDVPDSLDVIGNPRVPASHADEESADERKSALVSNSELDTRETTLTTLQATNTTPEAPAWDAAPPSSPSSSGELPASPQ